LLLHHGRLRYEEHRKFRLPFNRNSVNRYTDWVFHVERIAANLKDLPTFKDKNKQFTTNSASSSREQLAKLLSHSAILVLFSSNQSMVYFVLHPEVEIL